MNKNRIKIVNSVPDPSMSRFQVLRYNQEFMREIKIYSLQLPDKSIDFFHSTISYCILSLSTIGIVSSAVYVYSESSDFKATLDSIFLIITSLQAIAVWINFGLRIKNLKQFHNQLQAIVDQGGLLLFSIGIYLKL